MFTLHGAGSGDAPLDRRRKAAIVVRCLLAEGGAPPLAGLPESTQADLARELAGLSLVGRATLEAVAVEFAEEVEAVGLAAPSGVDAVLTALAGHISPAAAARVRAEAQAGGDGDPWAAVLRLPAPALAAILEGEGVEVAAVVLSKLPVARAAEALGLLPGERARRVAFAVSRTAGVSPDAVARIGRAVAAEHATVWPAAFAQAPFDRVGAILNSSARATREELLGGLEAEDRAFAAQVRRAIFTFAHLPQRLRAADVPRVLRAADARSVAVALAFARAAGGDDAIAADFVLASLPQRLADTLREEVEGAGTPKRADGEAAMAAVVAAARGRADAGEVALIDPADAEDDVGA